MYKEVNKKDGFKLSVAAPKTANRQNFGKSFPTANDSIQNGKLNFAAKIMPIEKIINNNILSALPDFDLARLLPHINFVSLAAGDELYKAYEFSRFIYFPETAVISHISDLENGGTIETVMVGNEGASGLSAVLGGEPAAHRAQVTVGGTACRISTDAVIQEFARGGEFQTLLLEYVNWKIKQLSQRLLCKAFHLVEKRLCGWLLMLCDRVKENRLHLTQENLALLLGTNRPTITISAQMLRKKGLINYARGGISIIDRRGLEEYACECYSILRIDGQIH